MYLANTLSHAFLTESTNVVGIQKLEHINHLESLVMTPEDLQRLQLAAARDEALQELCQVIQQGWPETKT